MNETSKKILLFLIVIVLNTIGYKAAQILRPDGFSVTTWLDSLVPYISYFVIPYALYVPVVLVPFFLYWKDYKNYRTVSISFLLILVISIIIYLMFQTTTARASVGPTDMFNAGVLTVYALDAPLNSLPSLHVSMTVIATLFIYIRNRKLGTYIIPITALIILSTVFIKQHAVLDVIAGLVLALAVFKMRKLWIIAKQQRG